MFREHYDLSRRFRPATKEGGEDRPFRGLLSEDLKGMPAWPELLEKRRTIVLAEAGSGKSSEFDYQCSALRQANKFAFKVTVRDVADAGFEASLVPADRARFAQWRADPDAPCWLFVDSVDEAKDQGHHFDAACRKLADAIAGLEERVHLYISSRYTDWDKTADRISVEKWLSLPEPPPPPTDVADEVRATLQNRDKSPPRVREEISVLVMEPLKLIKKVLYVGAFAFIIGQFSTLADLIFRSFSGLGITAGGGGLSADDLMHPGAIAGTGFEAAHPLLDQVSELSGFPEFFGNFLSIAVLLICWLLVVLAFFILAIQLFITILEFKLTALAGFVLVPFALWNKTSFLAERVLGNPRAAAWGRRAFSSQDRESVMAKIQSPHVCSCGLALSVFIALDDEGFDMLARATRMCPARGDLCPVRQAVLKTLFQ